MIRSDVRMVLWTPDTHELPIVAEAVESVLSAPIGNYCTLDVCQATYLLTTFRRPGQYVGASAGGAP